MSVTFTGADRVGSIGGYIGGIGQLLPGLFGNSAANCSENTPVTRYELDMALSSAAKDSKIALLEANIFTDGKFSALIKKEIGNKNQAFFRAYTVDVEKESVIIRLRIAIGSDKTKGPVDSVLHAGGNHIRFF